MVIFGQPSHSCESAESLHIKYVFIYFQYQYIYIYICHSIIIVVGITIRIDQWIYDDFCPFAPCGQLDHGKYRVFHGVFARARLLVPCVCPVNDVSAHILKIVLWKRYNNETTMKQLNQRLEIDLESTKKNPNASIGSRGTSNPQTIQRKLTHSAMVAR